MSVSVLLCLIVLAGVSTSYRLKTFSNDAAAGKEIVDLAEGAEDNLVNFQVSSERDTRELDYDEETGKVWAVTLPPLKEALPKQDDSETQSSLRFIRDMSRRLIELKREFFEFVAQADRFTRRPYFENLMVAAQQDCNGEYKYYIPEYIQRYWNFPSMGELPCLIDGFHEYQDPNTSFKEFLQEMNYFNYLYLPQYINNVDTILNSYSSSKKFVENFTYIKERLQEIKGVIQDTFVPNTDDSLVSVVKPVTDSSHAMRFTMLTIIEIANALTYLQHRADHYVQE